MISMYFRMFLALLGVIALYTALIYFVPITGEKIDETLGVTWNASLVDSVDSLLGKASDAQESVQNKLDNPAPNTSRKLDERLNGVK